MDDNKAQGWGKTLGGAIGASFGPEHALIGIAIGGVLEEILPGPKDILGNILGNLGSDGLKQAWQQTITRRTQQAQAQISSDLQQAFRDAVLDGLYDIGGSACFPDQWTKARRLVPDGVTIAPLTDEIREYLQALAAAISQGTLIPLESSTHAAVDAQHYVAAESFGDLNAAFLTHVIGPDKPFRSLRELPQLHGHLHRHWLDRTLVHLGDLLKQRPATWHEFNRVMFETLLVALRQLGTGQAQIAQQLESLTSALTSDPFVVGMSERQAGLLVAIGETDKDLREGITTIFRQVATQHAEVITRFDQQDTVLQKILGKQDQLLVREHVPRITALHALPARPSDFQGRTDEITQLSEALRQNASHSAVATIGGVRGLGGIGKTALATTVAQEIKSNYPDGQLFLELRGASPSPMTPEEALLQVLRAFGQETTQQETREELQSIYRSLLNDKRVLIVADDAKDEAQVEPLIPPSGSALLITSRSVIRLPGMPEPLRLDKLPEDDAVAFVFTICARIGSAAKDLARLCGYLPLALRISATFLSKSTRPVERYLDELAKERTRLLRLRGGSTDTNIEASFNLSYAALDIRAQMLLRQLGIFSASFDRRAAGQIVRLSDNESAIDDLLDQLYAISLLDYDLETERFSLHDLVRVFALERLRDQGEEQMTWLRYAVHYLAEAQGAEVLFRQGSDTISGGLLLFDTERPHIDAICERARQQPNETNDGLLIAFIDATMSIGDLRYHKRYELIPQLEAALAAARRQHNRGAEGRFLSSLGSAYWMLGEAHQAIAYFEQQLVIARDIGNRRSEGNALGNLGTAYAALGEVHQAIGYYERALHIARDIGDRHREANVLNNLGDVYTALGKVQQAIGYYAQQLAINRETRNWREEGNGLGSLGNAYAALGEVQEAIGYYKRAAAIFEAIGDRRAAGVTLGNLGSAYAMLGDTRQAIEHHERWLEIARDIGDRRGEGYALGNLGNVYAALDEMQQAIAYFEQALHIAQETGDRHGEARNSWNLGAMLAQRGELERAIELMQVLVDYEREIGHSDTNQHVMEVDVLRQQLAEGEGDVT